MKVLLALASEGARNDESARVADAGWLSRRGLKDIVASTQDGDEQGVDGWWGRCWCDEMKGARVENLLSKGRRSKGIKFKLNSSCNVSLRDNNPQYQAPCLTPMATLRLRRHPKGKPH